MTMHEAGLQTEEKQHEMDKEHYILSSFNVMVLISTNEPENWIRKHPEGKGCKKGGSGFEGGEEARSGLLPKVRVRGKEREEEQRKERNCQKGRSKPEKAYQSHTAHLPLPSCTVVALPCVLIAS